MIVHPFGVNAARRLANASDGDLKITSTMRFARSRYLFYVAVATPPAVMAGLIHRYGVNVPVLDEWDMSVPLVLRARKAHFN
jgi:hypothetical protein